jgi:serpin B
MVARLGDRCACRATPSEYAMTVPLRFARIIARPVLFAFLLASCHPTPPITPQLSGPALWADLRDIGTSYNAFGLNLFARLRVQKGNLFVSPLSIASMLTMLWAGARGDTAFEMQAVLHISTSVAPELDRAKRLRDSRTKGWVGMPIQVQVANRLFGDTALDFRAAYLDSINATYHAKLERLDFARAPEASRQRINQWVASVTENHVMDLVPPGGVDASTSVVPISAIHFHREWADGFVPEETRPSPFHLTAHETKDVPMMHSRNVHHFAAVEGMKIVVLPYVEGRFEMIWILPDEVDGLDAVEARLSSATLDHWLSRTRAHLVTLALPRFEIGVRSSIDLAPALQSMGVVSAFDPSKADFRGIVKPGPPMPHLGRIYHGTYVKVDEAGVPEPPPPPHGPRQACHRSECYGEASFIADHPFLFLIRDNFSGVFVFIGRVADPTAK